MLHDFQDLCGVEVQKILRHVCIRWLSLSKCVGRLNTQWPALFLFFESEIQKEKPSNSKEPFQPLLKSFTIPKLSHATAGPSKSKPSQQESKVSKRKLNQNAPDLEKNPNQQRPLNQMMEKVNRVVRIDTALKSDLTKAFSYFLEFFYFILCRHKCSAPNESTIDL